MSRPDRRTDEPDDLAQAWERGSPLELDRNLPPTSVLSVRIPTEMLRELSERARAADKPVSNFARDLIEDALLAGGPSTPAALAQRFARWVEEAVDAESVERSGSQPSSSFVANRLALTGEPAPSIDEMGLGAICKHAFAWQDLRSRTELLETIALMRDESLADRMREIGGLFGMAAELVLVAVEAEGEKRVLERHLDRIDCGLAFAHWRSLRFFAEGQVNDLVTAGHLIANVVLRTLSLCDRFDPLSVQKTLTPAIFVPFSDEREAWISLNGSTVGAMSKAARSLDTQQMVVLVERLEFLVAQDEWKDLFELRASQYHRWRGESPGVSGIDREDSVSARLRRGEAVGLGPELLPPYAGAEDVVRRSSEVGRRALLTLEDFMPEFLAAWEAARQELF